MWNEESLICLRFTGCEIEPQVPYGKPIKPYKNTIGSVLRFTCLEGYAMVGKAEVYCMEDGQWSMAKFQCVISKNKDVSFNSLYFYHNIIMCSYFVVKTCVVV